MSAHTLTAVCPNGLTTEIPVPERVEFEKEQGDASTMTLSIIDGWERYSDESDATNPLQMNSYITLAKTYTDGTGAAQNVTLFRGYVWSRELAEADGERVLRVICLDRLAKLRRTMGKIGGNAFFTETSPTQVVASGGGFETLYKMPAMNGGTVKYPFFPVKTSVAWLHNNGGTPNSTTLGANITGTGAVSIKAATTSGGLTTGGLIIINRGQADEEICYYEGYNSRSDTYWYFEVSNDAWRGLFGTTAQTHSAGATIEQMISQAIAPGAIEMQGYDVGSSTWKTYPQAGFAVQVEEGRFDFTSDPTTGGVWNGVQAKYKVFDETDASAIGLAGVIIDLLEEPASAGGPGLTASDYDIDISPPILLKRVQIPEATSTLDIIEGLLDEVGLSKGATTDAVMMHYRHSDGKIAVESIVQAATGRFLRGVLSRQYDYSLDEIFSGIEIKYSTSGIELLATSRMWHPQVGDTVGTNGASVAAIHYGGGTGMTPWTLDTGAGHNLHTNFLMDSELTKSWGIEAAANPGPSDANKAILYCWFESAADQNVDSIDVTFDLRRSSDATNPLHFKVMAVTSMNTGTPTSSTVTDIGADLDKSFDAGGGAELDGLATYTVKASGIGMTMQGIAIVLEGWATDSAGTRWWIHIKEVSVKGAQKQSVLVQLTKTDAQPDNYLQVSSATYDKMRPTNWPEQSVKIIDAGVMGRDAAVSLGRLALQEALILWQIRDYEVVIVEGVPDLGETVEFEDGFVGVVAGARYELEDGAEKLALSVVDYTSGLA